VLKLYIQIRKVKASAGSNFGASLWWVIDIFDDFSQNSSKFYFSQGIVSTHF